MILRSFVSAGALLSAGMSTVVVTSGAMPRQSAPDRVTLVRVPEGGLQPQVAVDGRTVHLVYFKGDAANGDVYYAKSTTGAFGAPLRVNTRSGSVIATGTVRGAHLAIGRNGRVHVAWMGSSRATPRGPGAATPMMYTRLNDAGTAFEPERNVLQYAVGLDGGGSVAADASGNVYVAWHAGGPDTHGEGDRRVWVARSTDDGRSFAREQAASPATTGACGCCGARALADRTGTLYVLYRSAAELVHRDTYLLRSKNHGASYSANKLEDWRIGACPMSTFALADSPAGVLVAWETGGQVQMRRIDRASGAPSSVMAPAPVPGAEPVHKHPAAAANANGATLLVWTEGTGWQRGGAVAWQMFGPDGRPTTERGRTAGVPTWSLAAAYARPDGGFTIVY